MVSAERPVRCVYEIDSDDKIVFCNAGWEGFALENGGEDLRFELVKGRSIWDFLTDSSTTDLYKRLIAHARKGNRIRFTFRCDSPVQFRLLEMKMSLTRKGHVRFSTKILHVEEMTDRNPLASKSVSSPEPIVVCSWCGKLNIYRQLWQDIDVAVAKVKIFEQAELPPVSHGICDDCLVVMRQVLNDA
jgi:hypothetical protein